MCVAGMDVTDITILMQGDLFFQFLFSIKVFYVFMDDVYLMQALDLLDMLKLEEELLKAKESEVRIVLLNMYLQCSLSYHCSEVVFSSAEW
jgi:hypothetical protein